MRTSRPICSFVLLAAGVFGHEPGGSVAREVEPTRADGPQAFTGAKAGDEREIAGMKLCWCPAGRFLMGSPRDEPERRPGEDQVEVTLTKGF